MARRRIFFRSNLANKAERPWFVKLKRPFATGIIDPDWPYTSAPGKKSLADVKNAGEKGRLSGYTRYRDSTKNTYAQPNAMSIEELKELPIGDVIGGYVFLWVVSPFLLNGAAISILQAWGFTPCSMLTWAKYDVENKHGYGGVGFWFLGNAEFCIVAKRKGWPSIRTGKSSLIIAPKTKHSEKPEHVHKICEERFPGPYIEIFGRQNRKKWTVIGDEAPNYMKQDVRHSLKKYLK